MSVTTCGRTLSHRPQTQKSRLHFPHCHHTFVPILKWKFLQISSDFGKTGHFRCASVKCSSTKVVVPVDDIMMTCKQFSIMSSHPTTNSLPALTYHSNFQSLMVDEQGYWPGFHSTGILGNIWDPNWHSSPGQRSLITPLPHPGHLAPSPSVAMFSSFSC